jgi:3-hydroxyisobutyrate dehydrogenase-like beta-hydroxyacid dehydrogenase
MATIAVVGLGAMGSRIAGRLLDAGYELVVWNRDGTKAEPLAARGATEASSPAEAARAAEAVITMVTDPDALRAVTEGADGVTAGGATVIQMSTVSPEATDRLAALLGERLLDAPVLGSISEVESGTLKIFAGGPAELVERWTPVLEHLGTVLPVGPVGAGTASKLVANTTLVGVIGVLGESLAVAAALGLPRETAFEVLGVTALADQAKRRRGAVEGDEYPPRFALSLARKDADLILASVHAHLPVVAGAREWLVDAEEDGLGDRDYSVVLARILEKTEASQPLSSDR